MKDRHRLAQSWQANARRWAGAVRDRAIASRVAGTDAACLAAIRAHSPESLLDMGCGEGWICRAVRADMSCATIGTDASPDLIAEARAADPDGTYLAASYEDLAADPEKAAGPFDMIVFNFALLDDDLATPFRAARQRLAPNGTLIVQTLHPWMQGGVYRGGWREETFSAFGEATWQPMPWYSHTLRDWAHALGEAGFAIVGLGEARHVETKTRLSLLITARPLQAPPADTI